MTTSPHKRQHNTEAGEDDMGDGTEHFCLVPSSRASSKVDVLRPGSRFALHYSFPCYDRSPIQSCHQQRPLLPLQPHRRQCSRPSTTSPAVFAVALFVRSLVPQAKRTLLPTVHPKISPGHLLLNLPSRVVVPRLFCPRSPRKSLSSAPLRSAPLL